MDLLKDPFLSSVRCCIDLYCMFLFKMEWDPLPTGFYDFWVIWKLETPKLHGFSSFFSTSQKSENGEDTPCWRRWHSSRWQLQSLFLGIVLRRCLPLRLCHQSCAAGRHLNRQFASRYWVLFFPEDPAMTGESTGWSNNNKPPMTGNGLYHQKKMVMTGRW